VHTEVVLAPPAPAPTLLDPTDDPEAVAESAGLRYVSDAEPGITRRRRGQGFSYHRPDGSTVRDDRTRDRIAALAVPPAWSDVWICRDPVGHLQATGRDAKGRKQYRYHSRWRAVRDENKYGRLLSFGQALPALRERIDATLRRPGLPREKVIAVVVHLLDETLIRVGNQEYAEDNESYGLTTITADHVDIGWSEVRFDFVGKGGVAHEVTVSDPRLARIVRRCHELGGQELFAYHDDEGQTVDVTSAHVNDYLRDTIGSIASAKDFRTWGGTVTVTEHLASVDAPEAEEAPILEAVDAAAALLRNTRAVCRSCYVHPAVFEAYRDASLSEAWRRSRSTARMSRAERATLAVLQAAGPAGVSVAGDATQASA
jgi:DNA topoisomerase I